jgi:hypothetical protein
MRNALAAAASEDVHPRVRAKLERLLAKAFLKLESAESAGQGRPAIKGLGAVGKQAKAIRKVVRGALRGRRPKIAAPLGALLLDMAEKASSAAKALRSSLKT